MRTPGFLFLLVVGLGLGLVAALPTGAAEKADADKITKLIEKLGSGDFAEREKAYQDLDALGAPALEALRKATKSEDAEVRRRADELVAKIEKIAEREKILKPTMVRLNYKDKPLAEAIEDVKVKTGLQITLYDPENKLAGRKITLDTGDKSLWEAFDLFCEKAGLVEGDPNQFAPRPTPPPRGVRPVPLPAPVPAVPLPAAPAILPVKPAVKPAAKPADAKEEKEAKKEEPVKKDVKEEKREPAKEEKPKQEPAKKEQAEAKPAPAPAPVAVLQVEVEVPIGPGGAGGGAPAPAGFLVPGRPGYSPYAPNQVVLVDGKSKSLPVHYAGAVRIRALPAGTQLPVAKTEKEILLGLQVSPEPRMALQSVMGVTIEKAVDDQGQSLIQAMANAGENGEDVIVGPGGVIIGRARVTGRYYPGAFGNQVAVKLQKGEKASKSLKELKGTVTGQIRMAPTEVLKVEKLLKAKGETAKAEGGSLKVVDVTKAEDGAYTVEVKIEVPTGMQAVNPGTINPPVGAPQPPQIIFPGGGGVIGGRRAMYTGGFNGLAVYDDKGVLLPMALTKNAGFRPGANTSAEYTFVVAPQKGQGEPAKISFTGSRIVSVDIPFDLKDVPLP